MPSPTKVSRSNREAPEERSRETGSSSSQGLRSSTPTRQHVPNTPRRSPRPKTLSVNRSSREVSEERSRETASTSQEGQRGQDSVILQQILSKLDVIHGDIKLLKEKAQMDDVTEEEMENFLPSGEKLHTPEDLEEFEEKMDDTTRRRIINWLASIQGGNDAGAIVRTIMRAFMTNHLMSHYSGMGQKGKMKFIGKPSYKVILFAARKASKKTISFDDIKVEVLEVLRNAPNKPGGSNYMKKKRRQNAVNREEENLQDESESE